MKWAGLALVALIFIGSIKIYRLWRSPFRPIVPTWKQAEWGFTSEETKE